MKLINFQYTDLKGKVTNRSVLVTTEPTDKLAGIDVSELSDEQIAQFAVKYDDLLNTYITLIEELKQSFDLKHSYRQFFPEKMVGVITETV